MEKNWKPQYDIICEFRQTIYSLQFSIWLLSCCCLKITETKIELGLGKPTTKLIIPLYNLQWHLRIQYFKTLCGMSAMPCTFNDAPTEIPQQFTKSIGVQKYLFDVFSGITGVIFIYISRLRQEALRDKIWNITGGKIFQTGWVPK